MKNFIARTFKPLEENYYSNKKELQLACEEDKQSYFYKKDEIRFYKIIFCVPSLAFKVYQVFIVKSEIWIVISDGEEIRAVGRGKNNVLEIDFNDITLPSIDNTTLPNDKIRINIYNDDRFSTKWNKFNKDNNKEPSENGSGGVIVEGP